jgi:hypothetical protein
MPNAQLLLLATSGTYLYIKELDHSFPACVPAFVPVQICQLLLFYHHGAEAQREGFFRQTFFQQ